MGIEKIDKYDYLLVSYHKSGRTWLRILLSKLLCKHFNIKDKKNKDLYFWLKKLYKYNNNVPKILVKTDYAHDRILSGWDCYPEEMDTSKNQYKDKKIIFLVRNPKSLIVSGYFHKTKRESSKKVFEGTLSEYVKTRKGGIDCIINFYNIWINQKHIFKDFLLVRYEDLSSDPNHELKKIIKFLNIDNVSEKHIGRSIEFASFKNMLKMEKTNYFKTESVKPINRDDRESYKVRQGKVDGYLDYLSEEEVAYLDKKINEKLDPLFGYNNE